MSSSGRRLAEMMIMGISCLTGFKLTYILQFAMQTFLFFYKIFIHIMSLKKAEI